MRKYPVAIIGWMLVIATLSSFIYLTTGENISVGWTSPTKILDFGTIPSITYYRGEFWVASFYSGWDTNAIQVIHSRDGKEWSSPIILAEGPRSDVSFGAFQLLKGPDGTLWCLWVVNKKSEVMDEVLYYSTLKNGAWGTPREILRLDRNHRIVAAGNAPGGRIVVVMHHGGASFVQSSIEYSKWNPYCKWNLPFLFSKSDSLGWVDVFLDRSGTLWLLYEERFDQIEFRTSEDGNIWTNAQKFPLYTKAEGILLQRTNGQFVFVLGEDRGSRSISFSQDGFGWSPPALIMRTGFEQSPPALVVRIGLEKPPPTLVVDRYYEIHSDATESDDGTLWYVCSVEFWDGTYMMEFSEQKYEEDLRLVRNLHMRNEAIFFGIYFLAAATWFVLKRSLAHASLRRNAYCNHIEKYMQNVQKNMETVKSWMFFGAFAFLIAFVMRLLTADVRMLPIFVGYSVVFWVLSGVSDLEVEKSIKKWKKYMKVIVPLGVFVTILMWFIASLDYSGMPLVPIMVLFLCILLGIILVQEE